MTNRIRISGRLQRGPRGLALFTDGGDLWVLDAYEPADGELDTESSPKAPSLASIACASIGWVRRRAKASSDGIKPRGRTRRATSTIEKIRPILQHQTPR